MLKHLQEPQKQKKLQEVNDSRQENVMDKLSLLHNKQYSGTQYGLLNHGIRVRDPSQMFMFGDKNLVQGFSNKLVCSHFQGWSQESAGLLSKQKSQQAGTFGKSVIGDQSNSNGSSTRDLATLNPLEQKILFKKEEGKESYEKTENSSKFPSIKGGSWSAVMQSAVAEASSSDAGLQEERSDLSFPNPQLSNENQPPNSVESKNHLTSWLHNKSHNTHSGKLKTGGYSAVSGLMDRSLGFPAPNSSGNMLELLHKLEKEHTKTIKISEVPKAETDDEFNNPSYNKSSRSPYTGLRLNPTSQRQFVNYFDPSRISQQSDHLDKPSQGPRSDNNQLPNQNYIISNLVSVKKEDGQEWSTRSVNLWMDVSMQQNPSVLSELPSTSYAANSRMETAFEASKYVKEGNGLLETDENVRNSQGFEDKRDFASKRGVIKNDSKLSQLTSHSKLNSSSNLKNHEASKTAQMSSIYNARFGDNAGKRREIKEESGSLERNSNSLVQVEVANQNMTVLKSKKRKYPAFEGLPWHKEVTEGSSRLHDISTAELEWAHSVVRRPEKLKELAEQIALDSRWVVQQKRRLNLTTQLMQLLLRPAPAIILSEDATAHCDPVIYYASKLALGDACSLLALSSKKNLTSGKGGIEQDLLQTIQGLIDRSKRLEDEFSRLEKGESSILEVRMDFQDLDKMSLINRFAKFHGRGPLVTASSGVASSNRKRNPRRYVESLKMPKMVPEGQNCLCL